MNSTADNPPNKPKFSEKLLPSPTAFIAVAILWPSVYLVLLPINQGFGAFLGAVLTAAIWLWLVVRSPRIVVAGDEFIVGAAHIPLKYLANARVVERENLFAERGPKLDARAFVLFQAGVSGLIKVDVIDKADPTPYWLVASRRADELVAALS